MVELLEALIYLLARQHTYCIIVVEGFQTDSTSKVLVILCHHISLIIIISPRVNKVHLLVILITINTFCTT